MDTPKRGAQGLARRAVGGQPPGGSEEPRSLLTHHEATGVLATRGDLSDAARDVLQRARVPATERAYTSDWRIYRAWCDERGVLALPSTAAQVINFLTDAAEGRALATIQRYRATISKAHKRAGLPSPCYGPEVSEWMHALSVLRTTVSRRAKRAVTSDLLAPMLAALAPGKRASITKSIRDRAILLLGAVSALRRSEIAALDLADLLPHPQGYAIQIRRSKTDQTGRGRAVAIYRVEGDGDPVAALDRWIKIRGREPGPLFLSLWKGGAIRGGRLPAPEVAAIVKRAARLAKIETGDLAAHSLRSGYVTQARRLGMTWGDIMEQTGHKKIETVKRYARDPADAFAVGKAAEAVARAFAGRKTS